MKKTIITFAIIGMITLGILIGVYFTSGENASDVVKFYMPNETISSIDTFSYIEPDYSKDGYYRITPGNQSIFYFMECINSTLIIEDNKLGCIKEDLKDE